jgi:hypothetical protein
MQNNLPVWKYYEKGFVDPLYSPYTSFGYNGILPATDIPETKDGYARTARPPTINSGGMLNQPIGYTNSSPTSTGDIQLGAVGVMVNEDLVRKNWHQSFQKMYDNRPCPTGWTPMQDGWCVQAEPENNGGTFYTQKMYQQFHLGQSQMEKDLIPFVEQQFFDEPEKKPHNVQYTKFWNQGNAFQTQMTGVSDSPQKGYARYKTVRAKDSYLA